MTRKIVCLCGSTRFSEAFRDANLQETLAGNIILTIGCDMRSDGDLFAEMTQAERDEIKEQLDALHLDKIALADEVLVLNVGGYVGDSTRAEITYAQRLRKPIRYLEPERRNWEVAWFQQLVLLAGGTVEPETLEDGLTQAEAEARRTYWQFSLSEASGVVVIARLSPSKPSAESANEVAR